MKAGDTTPPCTAGLSLRYHVVPKAHLEHTAQMSLLILQVADAIDGATTHG